MADGVKVVLVGERELRAAFKEVGAKMGPELRSGFKTLMGPILSDLQSRIPRLTGNAIGSVGISATTRGAGINWNSSAAPYYKWLDFGGTTGRGHHKGGGGAIVRKGGFLKKGRYVYPTVSAHKPETERMVDELIRSVARGAGFEVR